MNTPRSEDLAQRLAQHLTRRRGLGLLASAAIPMAAQPELATAKQKKKAQKITLCLNGQTIKAPKKKAKKLRQQGAKTGQCVVTTAPPRCGNGGPCFVFVSSGALTGGSIITLASADATCQDFADDAKLPGAYKAWLSLGAANPANRFTNINAAGPYVLPAPAPAGGSPGAGPTVAASFAALTSCGVDDCLQSPINREETGQPTAFFGAWTGTNGDGTTADETCAGWSSDAALGRNGETTSTNAQWTSSADSLCSTNRPLFCFQQAT